MYRVLVVLIFFLLSCTSHFGFAQMIRKKFKFGRIEANTELSNSNVTAILEDSHGFLWVGTDDGLNRFDGYDFKIYRNIEGDSTSLLKNKIQSIYEDSRGTLWISTLNSGLHIYDRTQDFFHRITDYSIQHCQVMRITEDSDHNIWIGGVFDSKSFVARLDQNTGSWKNFPLFETTDAIYSILQDSKDELWLGTRLNGLYKWNYKTNKSQHYQHNPTNTNSLPGDYIEKILRNDDGTMWIATRHGLSNFNPTTNEYRNFTADTKRGSAGLPVNEIMDICLDGSYLWIATENGGLSRLDIRSGSFSTFTSDKNDPNSLINNSIWALHKDSHGRIWIGSYAKGLCVLDDTEEKFSEVDIPLKSDIVNAIMKDSRGRLWIGTEAGIVMHDKNKTYYFQHDPGNNSTISSNAINCIFEDSKKRIWIAYWNGGMTLFNETSKNFRRFLPDTNRPNSLSNPNVFDIVESSSTGELIACTFNGIYILKDIQKGEFENVVRIKHEGDQLLRTGFEDSKGNIWVGSYSGLSRFDLKKKSFERFFVTNDTAEVSDRINSIFEDSKGRLWIGSFAGLHQKVSDTNFITYTTQDGLPVNIIQSILEDNKGNLWLGTTHGLCVFDPEKKTFKSYDESDGLLTQEFRRKASFKADDGQLFVGGKGINAFYPDSLSFNADKPFVYITDLKIFNQSVKPYAKDGILKQSITQTTEISLDHTQTFFSIHYVGINFTASFKNRYAYKLEGFDTDWNYVGDQRFATFTSLDPGTYTFKVKASNNDDIWNEEGTSLIIHVLPPWWKTFWFRALVIGLSIVIVVSIYYLRVSNIEQQNIRLENLVSQRTHELKEMNEALARQEREIKLQNEELIHGQEETATQRDMLVAQNKKLEEASRIIERKNQEILSHNENLELEVEKRTKELLTHNHQLEQFAYISAHNLRAPVARILGLGEVLKICKTPEEEKVILEKLVLTTKELDGVVKDLNKILEIRKNNTSVITEIDLHKEMELVRTNLQREIEETGTEIIDDFSAVDVIFSVKPYIDSILMNLISNSIKYRYPGRRPVIHIRTERQDEFVCINVSDNGLGINLEKYEGKMFKLYNRFHSHVEGKGLGLYLVNTQVAALGGRIEVSSTVNKGMEFKIFLLAKMENLVLL